MCSETMLNNKIELHVSISNLISSSIPFAKLGLINLIALFWLAGSGVKPNYLN